MRRSTLLGFAWVVAIVSAFGIAGSAPRNADAGGPFTRLIGVGEDGEWREIRLAAKGLQSDASLFRGGTPLALPEGGHVRLFPTIGGLPGIPGRYYPAERVLCWSWRQPDRDCWRANGTAVRLLAPLASLPRWEHAPTVLAELRYGGRLVRPALANLRVALELAFDRRGVAAAKVPASALRFTGRWRGPQAALRPHRFALGPLGVYSGGLLHRLESGAWAFASANRSPGTNTPGLTVSRPASAQRLYGIAGPAPAGLVRVDPAALRPLPGRRVPLAGRNSGWSFSPDRSQIVLGSDAPIPKIRLIDLRNMRALGDVRIARRGSVFATAWAGRERVLAVVVTPGCCGLGDTIVVGVDAVSRRVLWRRTLGGALVAGERFRRSLVLVLGPRGRSIGPARLVLVNPDGRLRSASLPEIRAGSETEGGGDPARFLVREWNPGLTVDPSGARAFVVQKEAPVTEVDLRTLRVRSHELSEPISLIGRLRNWLEPRAEAKAQEGPNRQALWLGQGRLAVTGWDSHASTDASGRQTQFATPAGLKLIDTRRWSVRTLDRDTSRIEVAAGTLFGYGLLFDSRSRKLSGHGLTGYTLDGSRRFHLYGDDPISGVQAIDERVIVGGAAGSRIFRSGAVIDARTGREIRRVSFDVSLLVGDEPFWF